MFRRWLALALLILPVTYLAARAEPSAELKFEVRLAADFQADVANGRVLIVLGSAGMKSPRAMLIQTGMDTPPALGADAHAPDSDRLIATLDRRCEIFPIENLAKLPPGSYTVQAVVHTNRDLNYPNAPGDLFGPTVQVDIDPAKGGVVKLEVNSRLPDEKVPEDTDSVKYLKFPSKLLSDFHHRPMFLRAAVVLPLDFEKNPEAKYPLRVHIGGYGDRYTGVRGLVGRRPADGPHFLSVMLDGAGPFGDPYQVNSDNNGPYGDALTKELIPFIEEKFRGIGNGTARFTDGHSTGGWVSFALQVFYPEFFNGCWSFCPDPVDFRAYELIDIYQDDNAYVNRHGFERPAMRQVNGETIYSVRHECQIENVLGRGDRWVLSGKDWCAWNATFGPRGEDGLPKPLWNGKTGAIDRSVVEHWKKYDLRMVLEKNWKNLGPKLRGKIHIYSGDCDDYFLNNAVRLLDGFLQKAKPAADATIVIGPYVGHGFHPLTEKQTLDAMWAAFEAKQKK